MTAQLMEVYIIIKPSPMMDAKDIEFQRISKSSVLNCNFNALDCMT